MSLDCTEAPHNNSLERTQPERGFKYDVGVLRRSARGRYAAMNNQRETLDEIPP